MIAASTTDHPLANHMTPSNSSHDQRLRESVHPPTWRNPTPKDRYHLVVIGAGTAGLVTAAGAAGLGARVALVERHLMGGDCLNVGCVPSKGLISAARAWSAARRAAEEFHGPSASSDGDFAAVMERMRRLRADIAPVDGAERFRTLGVDVFLGSAHFTSDRSIEVGESTLRFRRAVIATGGRAAAPSIPGLTDVPYLTNETLFDLTTRPAHLIVLGGGPIGCEMAQAFARLGSAVTLIERSARVLPRDDADAARIVGRALELDGVTLLCETDIRRVEPLASGVRVHVSVRGAADGGERVIDGSDLLVAIGRAPNVEGLGLETARVAYDTLGVTVNDRLQTSSPRIFAAGDVCSPFKFTHAADFQARTVIQNALFFGRKRASALVIPWATYTSPEVAQVGHTPASAQAAGVAIDTFTIPMHDVDRAILDGDTVGFARVHVRAGSDVIVGATVVAEHAGDLIAEYTLCMTNGLGLSAIGGTIHPYPTQSDALRKSADAWRKTKLTPAVRSLFAWWFRWFA
jgi:pyruvate/2-oxoglutarate dehydrogenase complex dihydrolipoamide dehydrogenase (E3) component